MEPSQKLRQSISDYKNGKADAFNILYEESSKYIYTCIYKVMSGNDNAQDIIYDIMQDTYVEISKSIEQLAEEERFLSWAGTIATRKCYAYLKKNKKYVLLNEEDNTFDTLADSEAIIPEELMQDREKQRLIREIIETELTEMQKLCIIAYYYNEQKQSEIAEELGIPENTVKTNLSRAKAKIKDGVLDLEKNKGTKLYSAAPLFLLLFREDVLAAEVPKEAGIKVFGAVSEAGTVATAGTSVAETAVAVETTAGTTTAAQAGIISKFATAPLKTKIIAAVVGTCVVGTAGGTAVAMTNPTAFQEVQQAVYEVLAPIGVFGDTDEMDNTEQQNDSQDIESTEMTETEPETEEYIYMPEWDIFAMEKTSFRDSIPATIRLGSAADPSAYVEYQCSRYDSTVHCKVAYLPSYVVNGEIRDENGIVCRRYYVNYGNGVEEKYYFRIFPCGDIRTCDIKRMGESGVAGLIENMSSYTVLQRVETENEYMLMIEYECIMDNAPFKGCALFVNDYATNQSFNIRIDQTATNYDSASAQMILSSVEFIRDMSQIGEYEVNYSSGGESMEFSIGLNLVKMEDRTSEQCYVRRSIDGDHRFYFKIAPRGSVAGPMNLNAKTNEDLIARLEKSTGNARVIRIKKENYQLAFILHDAMVDSQAMGGCELYINDYVNDKSYIVALYESMDYYSEENFRTILSSLDIKGITN